MTDDTTDDDSTATLTLHARGPAVVERDHERGAMTITESETVDLHATLEITTDWLAEHGTVTKSGAGLRESDIAELVVDRLSGSEDDGPEYYADAPRDEWELSLAGHLEDWLRVAVTLAQERVSVGTNDKIATVACHILDGLNRHANDRPRLAMLDLMSGYDIGDYSRAAILDELSEADDSVETTASAEQEVPADA